MLNILVIGAGYVGLSNAIVLAKDHNVKLVDIDLEKVNCLRDGLSPIKDTLMQEYISKKKLNIEYSSEIEDDIKKYNYVVIATPTDFIEERNIFDTSSIELTLENLNEKHFKNQVIIRSTIPIGFTKKALSKYKNFDIAFFPEFLREGTALYDSLHPSRIICGSQSSNARYFANMLNEVSSKGSTPIQVVSETEAEAIKLFSNSYLAMRVAFFNELDNFAMINELSAKNIIDGISIDPRIGDSYNNPSFGYGGYCLPKDIKQLKSSFMNIPEELFSAVINSNALRFKIIADHIVSLGYKNIGIYKLSMKKESDNHRESAIKNILKILKDKLTIQIYDPSIKEENIMGISVKKDFNKFIDSSELIVANRIDEKLNPYSFKTFTRDIFSTN